jgi:hypothetical protein
MPKGTVNSSCQRPSARGCANCRWWADNRRPTQGRLRSDKLRVLHGPDSGAVRSAQPAPVDVPKRHRSPVQLLMQLRQQPQPQPASAPWRAHVREAAFCGYF